MHDSTLRARTARARQGFRAWRRTRPFYAAGWTGFGGFALFYLTVAPVHLWLHVGIGGIYGASTAELFSTGLGQSLWLPVILAVLCVLGVLAGIWLRVKAFLFLGVSFLLLDIGTMIWHAAVNRAHTWVWWASGIVLGVAILALFALFEKRRNDVLRLLDDLKSWD